MKNAQQTLPVSKMWLNTSEIKLILQEFRAAGNFITRVNCKLCVKLCDVWELSFTAPISDSHNCATEEHTFLEKFFRTETLQMIMKSVAPANINKACISFCDSQVVN